MSSRMSLFVRSLRFRLGRRITPTAMTIEELLASLSRYERFLLEQMAEDLAEEKLRAKSDVHPLDQLFTQQSEEFDPATGFGTMHVLRLTPDMFGSPLNMPDTSILDLLFGMPGITALHDLSAMTSRFSDTASDEPSLIDWFHQDLLAVERGEWPEHNVQQYLTGMQLDGDQPDEKTLMERVIVGGNIFSQLRTIHIVTERLEELITAIENNELTEPQDAMARILAAIADKQLVREGGACPMAIGFGKRIAAIRPELLTLKAHAILQQAE